MSNNINWGKIYESTAWGSGVTDNNISWGKSYADLAGGGFTGLLDTYSGAAAAYSLRQLSSTYSGNAIKVRRASDNAEQDIAFANNELDTATLETFASGTDAFVTTWYDQSGNGNDAAQGSAAAQPKIVSSGSTILDNGKPIINGQDARLDIGLSGNSNTWIFATIKSAAQGLSILYSNNGSSPYWAYARLGSTSSISTSLSNESYYINGTYYAPLNINREVLFNLTQSQALFVGNADDSGISSSSFGYNASSIDMYQMKEFIVYTSDQSANRTGIETNINDFYSIY